MKLKKELCNKLIENGLVEEGDMIVHSYANNRLSGKRPINVTQNKDRNVSAVITTRPDTLGIVVKDIEDGDGVTLFESKEWGGLKVHDQIAPTLRANKTCAGVAEAVRLGGLFDKEDQKHQAGSVWDTNGLAPNIDTMQGGYRQPLINEPNTCLIQPVDRDYNKNGSEREVHIETKNDGISHALRTNAETMVNEHPWYSAAQRKREDGQAIETSDREYANAITTLQKDSMVFNPNLRIRKLTPKECWRLMGWDDESFEKAEKVNSNSALYKQAGNGIVINVLEAIFRGML